MQINFYKNLSDDRDLIKTLEEIGSANCQSFEPVTELTQRLKLDYNPTIWGANYAYNQIFNRYYFVVNKEVLNGSQMILTFKTDVLHSFATEILKNGGIIARSSGGANYYLDDPKFLTESRKRVVTKVFPLSPLTNQKQELILKVVSG